MKKWFVKYKKEIVLWGISLGLFVLIFAGLFALQRGNSPVRQPVDIVTMGDSIMGETRDDTSVVACLSRMTGKSVVNGCLGGTAMSYVDKTRDPNNTYEMYSMAALAKAISAKDFSAQNTRRFVNPATEYFEDTFDALERVDFEKTDVLFICHGLNDFHAGVPLENEKDPYDEYSYAGAVRSVVRNLRNHYPDLRIIFLTPTYTWYPGTGLTCENLWTDGPVLEQYVDILLRTTEELGIESIDLYHDFYDHASFEDWSKYTRDGSHPNEAGREKIARAMADYLKENP